MRTTNLFLAFLMIALPMFLMAQPNPHLKKYAGAYHLLAFGEETPTAASEKMVFTLDGKWTSTSLLIDENGVVSKVPLKKMGTWRASEGLVHLSQTVNGVITTTDFKLDDGMFMSSNTYLKKIFITNPIFVQKYSGKFDLLGDGEEKPSELSPVILLTPDGKCTRTTPTMDDNGVVTKTPKKEIGTWKANEGIIQLTFNEEGQDVMTEFQMKDGVFVDRKYNVLKKFVPPPPPGYHLKLYAGTYNMLADGQVADAKSDKYVLTPDGNGIWTLYGTSPVVTKGTWKASEGLIQLFFSLPGGGGDKGDDLMTDFQLKDGVFRAEGVFLKKIIVKVAAKK